MKISVNKPHRISLIEDFWYSFFTTINKSQAIFHSQRASFNTISRNRILSLTDLMT